MLERLRAENELEAAVRNRDLLDGSLELCRRICDVHAHVLGDCAGEEGLVRLDAAADVEEPRPSRALRRELGLVAKPACERPAHRIRAGAQLRLPPQLPGITHGRRARTRAR